MSEQIELELLWKHETDAAVLVADPYEPVPDETVWLPKSQIDIEQGAKVGDRCTFLIPEWLAIEKGLV